MTSRVQTLLVVIIILIGIALLWQNYSAQNVAINPMPTSESTPAAPHETQRPVPEEWQSGNSRFSQGSCAQDSDCVVSGCSSEVCGSEQAVTTCEFSESFPNAQDYSCACVQSVCGWQPK